jgi:hypothetical protein
MRDVERIPMSFCMWTENDKTYSLVWRAMTHLGYIVMKCELLYLPFILNLSGMKYILTYTETLKILWPFLKGHIFIIAKLKVLQQRVRVPVGMTKLLPRSLATYELLYKHDIVTKIKTIPPLCSSASSSSVDFKQFNLINYLLEY